MRLAVVTRVGPALEGVQMAWRARVNASSGVSRNHTQHGLSTLTILQDNTAPLRCPFPFHLGQTWLTGNADAIGSPDQFHGILIDSYQSDRVHKGQDAAIEATGSHLQRPRLRLGLQGLPTDRGAGGTLVSTLTLEFCFPLCNPGPTVIHPHSSLISPEPDLTWLSKLPRLQLHSVAP